MPSTAIAPTVGVTRASQAFAAAHDLAPDLSARALVNERLGTLAPDLVARARAGGLFGLVTPRALGGLELDPAEAITALEELCRADGSAGWSILIGNSSAFCAWLDPLVATDLLGDAFDGPVASVFAPTGRLQPSDDALCLDGRWSFASGSVHAEWFINGAFVMDGPGPRLLADRGPDWRLAVLPAGDVRVVPNWEVAGLRGTGSHDVIVDGLRVAEEHTISPFFEPARHDGPLWRFPFFTLAGTLLVSFPLGVARRALDEFATAAATKTRPGSFTSIAEADDIQLALAHAEGGVQSARAMVFDVLGEMWETACSGDVPDVDQRARFMLATGQAMRAAIAAVDTCFNLVGGSAIRDDQPLQRCFRDLHVGAQHAYFSNASAKRFAKARLGIAQPTFWF